VHGAFGTVKDWPRYAGQVRAWLASAPEVDRVVDRFVVHTGLAADEVEAIRRWIRDDLANEIDRVVASDLFTQRELSDRLANAGVLPMFGFPTRVRTLFFPPLPGRSADEVSDRPLGHAVSAFAPGAQVTKDGWVYTANGFADYGRRGDSFNPMIGRVSVIRCTQCGCAWSRQGDGASMVRCPVCQAAVRETTMYQPAGFRTEDERSDERSESEPVPSASRPELGWVETPVENTRIQRMDVWAMDQAQLLTVNDNAGALYSLKRLRDGSFIAVDPETEDRSMRAAIGELRVTDALLVLPRGVDLADGAIATLPRSCPSGRAAMRSFAEALRRGCQAELDIEPAEITVGLQGRLVGHTVSSNFYIADTLENGAGYATELSRPERLIAVVSAILDTLGERWQGPSHLACDSSCPDCLRSYDNRHLHADLDWRLALDVAELSLGMPLSQNRWLSIGSAVADAYKETYSEALDGHCYVDEVAGLSTILSGGHAVLLCHPLWRLETEHLNGTQRQAHDTLSRRGLTVHMSDVRSAFRFPEGIYRFLAAS
jgi:DEAD/DEAH box helicase domain-containing protein